MKMSKHIESDSSEVDSHDEWYDDLQDPDYKSDPYKFDNNFSEKSSQLDNSSCC